MKPPKPGLLVPKLVVGGFLLLLSSWLVFMASYLYREAHRPRTGAEIRLLPAPKATNAAPHAR